DEKKLLVDEESQEIDCSPERKLEDFIQPAAYLLLTVLIFITMFPTVLPAVIVRPLVTIGTGCLMLISDENLILSNSILTYIGDISYSLYLIHWPIYAYWKLTCEGDKLCKFWIEYLARINLFAALISSVILAIITFETFEKWYLKLSSTNIGVIVVILCFLNITAIKKDDIMDRIYLMGKNVTSLDDVTNEMTVDDAIRLNTRWSVNDMKNLYAPSCTYEVAKSPLGWCRHTVRCEAFYRSLNRESCRQNYTHFAERMENEKPDYAFNVLVPPQNTYFMARKRYAQLIKDCGKKCVLIDYVPEFYQEDTKTFRVFDKKGFSYFTTPSHLTPRGIEKIRHIWTDICRKL
ncbi:hypothetical protein CRE_13248, partial [Caenorhabditis remanei]